MAVRRSLFAADDPNAFLADDQPPPPWLPGGSLTVPPTAQPIDLSAMAERGTFRLPPELQIVGDASALPAGAGSSTLPASFGGPLPAGQTPPPGINPQVVYTDPMTGQGYNPNELQQQWEGNAAFRNNPLNARVGDILGQYGTVIGTEMAATPTSLSGNAGGYGSGPSDANAALIDETLADLLRHQGATRNTTRMMDELMAIIERGGDVDPMIRERSLNMARDAEATAMEGQTEDLRAQLASRGRASTPGVTQGGEVDALTRLTERLAPIYAGQVAGIENTAASMRAASLHDALSLATGLSSDEARNLLGVLGQGTDRQTALGGLALQQLSQDQQWNEFMASYGLEKDKVAALIQQGNIQALLPYLELFLKQAEQGAQGYIGND